MKRFISGLIVGIIIVIPVTAYAVDKINSVPTANLIYAIPHDFNDTTVSVFDDADNKCYVVTPPDKRDTKPSISCVKR